MEENKNIRLWREGAYIGSYSIDICREIYIQGRLTGQETTISGDLGEEIKLNKSVYWNKIQSINKQQADEKAIIEKWAEWSENGEMKLREDKIIESLHKLKIANRSIIDRVFPPKWAPCGEYNPQVDKLIAVVGDGKFAFAVYTGRYYICSRVDIGFVDKWSYLERIYI